MEKYIYYLTQRPFGPGCAPIHGLRRCTDNYDKRTYIRSIKREAWARLEYCVKLTDKQVANYELTYSPNESKKSKKQKNAETEELIPTNFSENPTPEELDDFLERLDAKYPKPDYSRCLDDNTKIPQEITNLTSEELHALIEHLEEKERRKKEENQNKE